MFTGSSPATPRREPQGNLAMQALTKEAKIYMLSQADELLIQIILKNTKVTQPQVDQALADCQTAKSEGRDLDLAHSILNRKWLSRAELYKLVKARNFALMRQEDK